MGRPDRLSRRSSLHEQRRVTGPMPLAVPCTCGAHYQYGDGTLGPFTRGATHWYDCPVAKLLDPWFRKGGDGGHWLADAMVTLIDGGERIYAKIDHCGCNACLIKLGLKKPKDYNPHDYDEYEEHVVDTTCVQLPF